VKLAKVATASCYLGHSQRYFLMYFRFLGTAQASVRIVWLPVITWESIEAPFRKSVYRMLTFYFETMGKTR
jgi:hypothetical protein